MCLPYPDLVQICQCSGESRVIALNLLMLNCLKFYYSPTGCPFPEPSRPSWFPDSRTLQVKQALNLCKVHLARIHIQEKHDNSDPSRTFCSFLPKLKIAVAATLTLFLAKFAEATNQLATRATDKANQVKHVQKFPRHTNQRHDQGGKAKTICQIHGRTTELVSRIQGE